MPANPQPTVLVVEDHPESRELLVEYLQFRGFQVEVAENGEAALKHLSLIAPPNLILLDLTMPVMDGWALRRALLADQRWAQIPVVVVSALHGMPPPEQIHGTVPKPVNLDLLVETIQQLVA